VRLVKTFSLGLFILACLLVWTSGLQRTTPLAYDGDRRPRVCFQSECCTRGESVSATRETFSCSYTSTLSTRLHGQAAIRVFPAFGVT